MRLVNLAHGDLGIMAAFVALACVQWLHLPVLYSGILAVVIMFVVGYALQRGLLNFTLGTDDTRPILVTFGLSIILQNALLIGFSADTQGLQATSLTTSSIHITNSLAIGYYPLGVFIFSVLFIAGLQLFLARTKVGRAFRAVSDDREAAELMGINNRHIFAPRHGRGPGDRGAGRRAHGHPHHVRPDGRVAQPHLRVRGRDHGRHGLVVGHHGRRRAARCGADTGLLRRSAPAGVSCAATSSSLPCWRCVHRASSPRR